MALQGTIDSFALADVMRLLGSSSKTGRLIVNGDRGSANLWFAGGDLVGGGSSTQPGEVDVPEVVFDILRYRSGSFIFEADAANPAPGDPASVTEVIEQAEAALVEWADIVRVVPSLDSWISLAPELQFPEVVVDQACWTAIVTVGGGTTVRDLGARLDLGELPASRLVRALVGAGFVDVGEIVAAPEPESGPATEPVVEPAADLYALPSRHPHHAEPAADGDPGEDLYAGPFEGFDADGGVALPSLTIAGLTDDPFADEAFPAGSEPISADAWGDSFDALVEPEVPSLPTIEPSDPGDPTDVPDVARSMSMLSDRAAQALASVAGKDAAPTVVDGGDDDADPDEERARMLRFLGSV